MSRLDVPQTVKVEWLVRRPEEGGELANPHDPEPQQGARPIRRTSCRSTERCLRVCLLLIRGAVREGLYALALLTLTGAVASAQPVCPGTATLTVFVENLSGTPTIAVELDGELAADTATCGGSGATSYRETVTCTGSGVVRCGQLAALQPGTWVHRLSVTVPGSATQQQAQRLVLVAGSPAEVSNALVWTVYPQTFVVQAATAAELQARLDAATAYTRANPGPALVTFSADAFPGTTAPQRIYLLQPPCSLDVTHNRCSPGGTWDGWTAGVCFLGDRIGVDALDRSAQPGGVILSVGTCGRQVLRLYGSDNVLRGLVFEGSRKPNPKPPCQVDTVAMTGARARRNRIEQSLFVGPTCGDTVSVDSDAGQPDDDGPGDNVIVDGRITNAADKGGKVDCGGFLTIERTCLHDNRNGGIQSTLGGHVVAIENVVQHNVAGSAQNGLTVKGAADRSTLVTEGNVVRFSGGRGLSVTDNAEATFQDDYVADNQFAGSRVETTASGPVDAMPAARFHGVALVCNRQAGLTGTCDPPPGGVEMPCTTVEDCCTGSDGTVDAGCVATTRCAPGSFPSGFGAVIAEAAGHAAPDVSYGDALQPGRNAFTSNRNTSAGANFRVPDSTAAVPAEGNQWEHCATGSPCSNVAQDISPPDGPIDLGAIPDPRATDGFGLVRVTPPRPRVGEVVRVYGEVFDAIAGNPVAGTGNCADLPVCAPDGTCPTGPCVSGTCPCSIASPAVQLRNAQSGANRIRIEAEDGTVLADATGARDFYPDAVTPTMLAFRMPFDCFAPLTLEVSKGDPSGNRSFAFIPLCDPKGCADQPAGTPCDDGDACALDDRCDGNGSCVGGAPLVCDGPCLACDPMAGCVPKPVSAGCDDGDACTTGDHCSGDGNVCVSGQAVVCGGQCLTGACDPLVGCLPKPADRPCTDGNACTVGDHCSGTANVCVAGAPSVCDGPCLTGICDPQAGCRPKEGVKALTCRVDECRRARLHRSLRKLAVLMDQAVEAGKPPSARRIRRFAGLLARCGVSVPPPPLHWPRGDPGVPSGRGRCHGGNKGAER